MKTIVLLMVLGLVGCLSTEEIESTEEEQDETEEVEQPVDYQDDQPKQGSGCSLYSNGPAPVMCQEFYLEKGRPPENHMHLPEMYMIENNINVEK